MATSKRKELRVYYLLDSYDEKLVEFIKDYAIARGQSYTEVILEILRAFWLPIALKDSDIDPIQLKDLQGKSIGILRSQLSLMGEKVDTVTSQKVDGAVSKGELTPSVSGESQENLEENQISFDESVKFDSLF